MQFNATLEKGRKVARANGINLFAFKKGITKERVNLPLLFHQRTFDCRL